MRKVREPKHLLVDAVFYDAPEVQELIGQGHHITPVSFAGYDMIISPKAQMTPPGRLAYVVKKLKDIVKEVAK